MAITQFSDKEVLTDDSIVSRRVQYSDLNLKLKLHAEHKDIIPLKDIEAVKQSVKNLVLTSKKDRLFQPWLGSGLRDLLFEPADSITMSAIKREIYDVINKYEPRVRILAVDVIDESDTNSYRISIMFQMVNLLEEVSVEFYLERVR